MNSTENDVVTDNLKQGGAHGRPTRFRKRYVFEVRQAQLKSLVGCCLWSLEKRDFCVLELFPLESKDRHDQKSWILESVPPWGDPHCGAEDGVEIARTYENSYLENLF